MSLANMLPSGLRSAVSSSGRRLLDWKKASCSWNALMRSRIRSEVREFLPDGIEFKAVWSYLPRSGVAKLVTVHFFDRG